MAITQRMDTGSSETSSSVGVHNNIHLRRCPKLRSSQLPASQYMLYGAVLEVETHLLSLEDVELSLVPPHVLQQLSLFVKICASLLAGWSHTPSERHTHTHNMHHGECTWA